MAGAMLDAENFDEHQTDGVLFDSPRSAEACSQLGIDQSQLWYVPWKAFLRRSHGREEEARKRQEHWRHNRARLLSEVRALRQANILRMQRRGNQLLPLIRTPCGTASLKHSASTSPRSAASAISKHAPRATFQISDVAPARPDAVALRTQREARRCEEVQRRLQQRATAAEEKAREACADRRHAARLLLKQWEATRSAAVVRQECAAQDAEQTASQHDHRRDHLNEQACHERAQQAADHRALRAHREERVQGNRAVMQEEAERRAQEKAERARQKAADLEQTRALKRHAREMLARETESQALERLHARDECEKSKVKRGLDKQQRYEEHLRRAEEEKRQMAIYKQLVDVEKQSRKRETFRLRVSKEEEARATRLHRIDAMEEKERAVRERKAQEAQERALEKELQLLDKEEAAAQARRRQQYAAGLREQRLAEKMARIEEARLVAEQDASAKRQNQHRMWIARRKLQPLSAAPGVGFA